MKLQFLSALLAVSFSSVTAAPMKWLLISNHHQPQAVDGQVASAVRVGLYMPSQSTLPQGHPSVDMNSPYLSTISNFKHRPECKGMIKKKTIELSNRFRAVLGLPLIDSISPSSHDQDDHQPTGWHKGPPYHRMHHLHHKGAPFVARLTHALNNLGEWEGRAVAFVIGCGLGVLLRIAYVFVVLVIRSCRGGAEEEEEDTVEYVVFETDVPATPAYLSAEEEKEQLKATFA